MYYIERIPFSDNMWPAPFVFLQLQHQVTSPESFSGLKYAKSINKTRNPYQKIKLFLSMLQLTKSIIAPHVSEPSSETLSQHQTYNSSTQKADKLRFP